MKISKSTIIIIAVFAVLAFWAIGSYNGFVSQDEKVKKAWGNVETTYQRRADLIPNAISMVEAYAKHERKTLNEVMEARAKATQMTINVDDLNEETLKKFQEAQSQLQGAFSRLMAVSEAYPELKSNEGFLRLQAQYEGTENRIAEARKIYNNEVQEYNTSVRKFPGVIFSSLFGFSQKAMFQADEGASHAPKAEFNL